MRSQHRNGNMRRATSKEDGMELIEVSIVLTLVLVVGHIVATVTE
jgi:hypothetical protein